jgi:predicted acylesterase/phospholipase RssA
MPQQSQSPAVDAYVEEVRVAMALNGGVSLAVWMGGCAVELDCARRARLAPEEMRFDGFHSGEKRRAYHGLCRAFGRRLSIDILSGASAGGVNGALLSATMVSGRRLHPKFVRDRWLELGDLSRLLRNPGDEAPKALMDGAFFHQELLRAFRALRDEPGDGTSRPDDEMLAAAELPRWQAEAAEEADGEIARTVPYLDVTMTDAIGTEVTFTDEWGLPLVAREHAPRFQFRSEDDYTPDALAIAARTSASFPIAFEPQRLPAGGAELAGLKRTTFGIDGGLLDNAPIRAALDLIPFRRAGTRVRRYACYVNADPVAPQPADTPDPAEPQVADVLGFVLELPRTAPFAGQLYAVREAANRGPVTQTIVRELLQMDLGALQATADALLPAYQQRRTAHSIEELIEDPAAARAARDAIDDYGAELPWIPTGETIEAPAAGTWEWGIRPAQRVLYLLLDLLREALGPERAADETLLSLRALLEGRIAELERMREEAVEAAGGGASIERLAGAIADRAGEVYALLAATIDGIGGAGPDGVFALLFRPSEEERAREEPTPPLQIFFRRVLAIEVVRRALADDVDFDTGQTLRFVQLTPASPTPILSPRPLSEPAKPASARDKLLGTGLAHFAGFYRRAWRANDYMWGRLDAAARVVDLLLDQPPEPVDGDRGEAAISRASALTEGVLGPVNGAPDDAELFLVQEALADHALPADMPAVPPPAGRRGEPRPLRRLLFRAIQAELLAAPSSPRATDFPFIRTVLARAAQLEVLRDELPALVAEARGDAELGSSGLPLDLDEEAGLPAMIEALRSIERDPGDSLRRRLTGEDEAVSRLGMTTISRAARVGIAMFEPAAPPPSKALTIFRPPAALLAAIASHDRLRRLSVAIGASAARLYRWLRGG